MDSNLLNPPASTSSSSSSSSQPTIGGIKSQQQQQQQTSTPYNDTIGKKPGLNVSYSSPSNQSCLTDNKHLANVITLNGSEISFKAVNSANKNVLAANINISNVSSGSLLAMGGGGAGGHNNSTNGSSNHRLSENSNNPDVVSYQRIKKVVIETSTSTASQVKLKEDQLRHLQSIDLNKYSFPNENKPKTDYTYAKSSSYKTDNKADDNNVMPNLCRRARRSPQTSSSSLFNLLPSFSSVNKSGYENSSMNTSTHGITGCVSRLFKSYIRSDKFASNRQQQEQQEQQETATSSSIEIANPIITVTNASLARSLTSELDDEQVAAAAAVTAAKSPAGRKKQMKSASAVVNAAAANTAAAEAANMRQTIKSASVATMTSPARGGFYYEPELRRNESKTSSSSFCCTKLGLCMLLLAAIPLALLGAHTLDESGQFFQSLRQSRVYQSVQETYLNLELNDMSLGLDLDLDLTRSYLEPARDKCAYFLFDYLPGLFALENIKSHTDKIKETFNDYQPFSWGSYDLTKSFFDNDQKTTATSDEYQKSDLMSDLDAMKAKILAETKASLNTKKATDIELIRRELDLKFNYTWTIMSNKLADQLSQFEKSKNSYESEMQNVKSILKEMEGRYTHLLTKFQEKQQLQAESEAAAGRGRDAVVVDDDQLKLRETLADEHVSFKKIEEYINRSFFLFNADKTGMTDFASESVGGAILFTRCTEEYLDNARWLTVFDVPIKRIAVSPRVVIQNSIQPGNCWAFKGNKADMFIKLAAKITPTSFSLEHIPKELSLTGTIDSAPQNFTVYGYESKDRLEDKARLLLGNYRYDNESKSSLQFFNVQHEYLDKPINAIELKIESNSGNKDHTCLYKFRVHGRIFQSQSGRESAADSKVDEKPMAMGGDENVDQTDSQPEATRGGNNGQ